MKNIPHHLAALATTLWVGGLWAIGYLAAPILFHGQPDKQLAGMLAGQMFEVMGYTGMFCGTYLLLHRALTSGKAALREPLFAVIAAMLVITLTIQFGIQPLMAELKTRALPLDVMQSAFADQFKMWHGISSILYLTESLLGAWLAVKTFRVRSDA
ncbi:membrane protein [Ferrigenium kumadai]|uniref:Membrane protein n=1 Tax=Ferrigenium kumadai TaxID=1682490 RepID=A0AAN1SZE7_9PROT|nr:DUF4149 domain-containing protein [Ferrigenium kumadai]BBI99466.1 membrane protein [Ferrigenium kumadai]